MSTLTLPGKLEQSRISLPHIDEGDYQVPPDKIGHPGPEEKGEHQKDGREHPAADGAVADVVGQELPFLPPQPKEEEIIAGDKDGGRLGGLKVEGGA